jgi:hypothetical protein
MNIPNEDVRGVVVEVPPGRKHVRTTVLRADNLSRMRPKGKKKGHWCPEELVRYLDERTK